MSTGVTSLVTVLLVLVAVGLGVWAFFAARDDQCGKRGA